MTSAVAPTESSALAASMCPAAAASCRGVKPSVLANCRHTDDHSDIYKLSNPWPYTTSPYSVWSGMDYSKLRQIKTLQTESSSTGLTLLHNYCECMHMGRCVDHALSTTPWCNTQVNNNMTCKAATPANAWTGSLMKSSKAALTLQSAPLINSSLIMSACPLLAARCAGVVPTYK